MDRALIVSSSADARLRRARAWLGERVEAGIEVRLVSSSRGAADDLLRSLPNGAFGVERLSLMALAHELAAPRLAAAGCSATSRLGAVAIATRVAAGLPAGGFFAPILAAPGFPVALERTLRELRLAGADPAVVASWPRGGAELAQLLTGFERALREAEIADEAEVLATATTAVRDGAARRHALLLLDLAVRTRAEAQLIEALATAAPMVLATAPTLDHESRGRLELALGTQAVEVEEDAPGRLGRLRRHLFVADTGGPPDAVEVPEDGRVTLVSAGGEGREYGEIAVRIRELAATGVPFDDIAVGLHDPNHLGVLDEAFSRAQIPTAPTREARRPDPAGRAFLALLACAEEGISASRFAEYLSLGQVPELDATGALPLRDVPWVEPSGDQLALFTPEPVPGPATSPAAEGTDEPDPAAGSRRLFAPRLWERLLVDAAVIGGRDRWRRRLDGLLAELELRRRELLDDEPRTEALERRIKALRRLEDFALPVVDQLAELPSTASWGTWIELLSQLAARVLRSPEGVLGVLGELAPMAAVGPVGLTEVSRVLAPRLSFLQREPERSRYGRVFVGSIDDLRGRAFHTVFVPGLADGVFPRRALEDPLLLDEARASLGVGLAVTEDRVARERLLLAVALGAAREAVVVSWSRFDLRQGRARTPSFYALDVARAASGSLEPLDELQASAALAAAARQGWPAPVDPHRALDDGEFDLAVVAELRRARRPGELPPPPGAGNYLLEVEPALARALTARGWRWSAELTDLDGLLARPSSPRRAADPELAALLASSSPKVRPYSPTALQHFASCPYRFLLQAIHRLRPREEVEALETMDPLTRGSLFHQIQFEALTALRAAGELPLGLDRLAEALELLDGVIQRVTGTEHDRLAPAIERVWVSEIEELRIDLRGWLRALAEEPGWTPTHFELAFGLAGEEAGSRDRASSVAPAEIAGGYLVRGSIDLVESDGHRARVTDHKTGRAAAPAGFVIGGGAVLQPLIYALAAETLLGRPVASGRLWYATRRGGYIEREVAVDADTRARLSEVLEIVERAIADPFFPALPQTKACDYCDYRLICGPEEARRAAVKKPRNAHPSLLDLVALRKMS